MSFGNSGTRYYWLFAHLSDSIHEMVSESIMDGHLIPTVVQTNDGGLKIGEGIEGAFCKTSWIRT